MKFVNHLAMHAVSEAHVRWQRRWTDQTHGNVHYDPDFGYRIARTAEENHAAWRLRYRVYCEETGFLPKEENLNGFEFDEHDGHARQSLLIHRETGLLAGTVRLILPNPNQPYWGLPARQHSSALQALPNHVMPHATTAEISRFSVDPMFRRRRTDGLYPEQVSLDRSFDPRQALSKMMLGLVVSLVDMSIEAGVTHVCAIIDPALLRLLRRLGVVFNHVGAPIEFHGLRQPVFGNVQVITSALCARFPHATRHFFQV